MSLISMLLGVALDGAVSGLVAVLLMTLFETPFWLLYGIEGVVQWQVNEITISKILSRPYVQNKRLPWAIGMHVFHGIMLGTVFAVVVYFASLSWLSSRLLAGLAGLAYTVVLWLFVPFGSRKMLQMWGKVTFTARGMVVSLLAHLVYGLSIAEFLFILLR